MKNKHIEILEWHQHLKSNQSFGDRINLTQSTDGVRSDMQPACAAALCLIGGNISQGVI